MKRLISFEQEIPSFLLGNQSEVHLICQLHVFLCSRASACIDSISCDLSRSVVAKASARAMWCQGLVSRDRPMCRGAHSVRTEVSGMPLGKAKCVARPPYRQKRSRRNSVCSI